MKAIQCLELNVDRHCVRQSFVRPCNIYSLYMYVIVWYSSDTSCIVSTGLPHHEIRSQVKRDYPLNLSILIRGGKENNHDTLSNGE
jgi:hypothetical protein